MRRLILGGFILLYCQTTLAIKQGDNLPDCATKLSAGEWCEITGSEPSKYLLTKDKALPNTWGHTGVKSVIVAWTGMASDGHYYYLTGGGHGDYGGNEVYRYDPYQNVWKLFTPQSELTHWFIRGKNMNGVEGFNKYCHIPDTRIEPSSTHTYDGIEFNSKTNELIVSVYGGANQSCIDININTEAARYKTKIEPKLIPVADTGGVYALSLDTLKWRKLYTSPTHTDIIIRTEFRDDGVYFFGNRTSLNYGTFGANTIISKKGRTAALPSAGDGVLVWDQFRNKFWSDHASILWELDRNGNYLKRHNEPGPSRDWRALVIDKSNHQLVKWDGANKLQIFTPETGRFCDEVSPAGRQPYSPSESTASWTARQSQLRIYTKFKYVKQFDVFAGLSEFDKPWLVHKRSHTCLVKQSNAKVNAQYDTNSSKLLTLAQRVRLLNEGNTKEIKNNRTNTPKESIQSQKKISSEIPYNDIPALQAMGLLPEYGIAKHRVNADTNIDWSGTGGERSEIGLFPEQHAAFIAGQTDLKDSIMEAALDPPPLTFNHTHHPNEFWLPYLLTGNSVYIDNLEAAYKSYKDWRSQPYNGPIKPMLGREAAWNLRDLVQLAYLQGEGLTTETYYIGALNASRDRWINQITPPVRADRAMFNVLDFNSAGANTHGFTGWMQAMFGQVLNYTAFMMKDPKWVQLAEWHFQHLLKSSGDKWPLKAVGYDHVFMIYFMQEGNTATWRQAFDFAQTATWDTVSPYPPSIVNSDAYKAIPDNHIPPVNLKIGRYPLTYANRAQYAYGWAALACKNDISRACEKAKQLFDEVTLRGDSWGYKNGVIGMHNTK